MFSRITISLLALTFSISAYAHDYKVGALKIAHPYARATLLGQPSGGAYLSMENMEKRLKNCLALSRP